MLRWLHIQSNDVGRFLFKIWIVGQHVALNPLRLKSRPLPDSGHCHVVDAKVLGQFTRAPMRRAVGRRTARPFQDLGFQFRGPFFHPATRVARVQTG